MYNFPLFTISVEEAEVLRCAADFLKAGDHSFLCNAVAQVSVANPAMRPYGIALEDRLNGIFENARTLEIYLGILDLGRHGRCYIRLKWVDTLLRNSGFLGLELDL